MISHYQKKFRIAGLILYTFLIIYGTLYPIDNWDWSLGDWSRFLSIGIPKNTSYADLVMNFLIYIPFGFFLQLSLSSIKRQSLKILTITLIGFLLSTTLEYFQQFLPGRTSSLSDIFLNTIGTLLGVFIAYVIAKKNIQRYLKDWKESYLSHLPYSQLGLTAGLLWGASQLIPFVPSLEISNLKQGFTPFWHTLQSPDTIIVSKLIISALSISVIFLILRCSLKKNAWSTKLIIVFIIAVFLLKVPVVTRQLSLEAFVGFFIAILIFSSLYKLNVRLLKFFGLIMLVVAYTYASLIPGDINLLPRPMNWVPFSQQMNTLVGIGDLLEQIAIFSAFAYLLSPKQLKPGNTYLFWTGGFILLFVFTTEFIQQFIPGRYSDITDVVIAFLTWFICIKYPWNSQISSDVTARKKHPQPTVFKKRYLALAVVIIFLLLLSSFIFKGNVLSPYQYELPEVADLPAVKLSYFKKQHPRLPAPSKHDIYLLETQNKDFFKKHRRSAKGGKLYSRILMAYVYPGSVDLDKLFTDVMAIEPTWRGHEQTKPIALSYDWLYRQWTPDQRVKLRQKVIEACDYQIHVIRDKYQLSPYNVYLYNSPLQALVAASIALHKDIPESDDKCMRFTHDYWTRRVIPVWKQVMGKNGGWHEGNEYIGIGIGKAVYQIPAMWRNATGIDHFQMEPGIRGFLDFLVYRKRPDGTNFRWGDGSFFNTNVPDRLPLAMELNHQVALNLKKLPQRPQPSSWPWGPLVGNSLVSSQADKQLPLSKFFDGIGLMVSRTNWDKDATYVTFKAGDNFWSHTHLDQGAFTIFKGGALAIDSGLYGPSYGADHHMNYSYQSIAHNVLTITDPEDNSPMPIKKRKDKQKKEKPPRKIANDGGQRRVGSGWGKKAPLDRQDWLNQSDIYHTAKIEKLIEKNNIIVVSADLTPAYNNSLSGTQTFADRTKRVKNYQRIFIHDKNNDLIIIFDKMIAFHSNFRKKWLLHSLYEPNIKGNYFRLSTPANSKLNMSGGKLQGKILVPENPLIQKIGGRGFEFYVDGKNYDGNGQVIKKINKLKNVEAGSWRLEVQPPSANESDIFLVVLQPSLLDSNQPFPHIKLEKDENRIKCIINEQTQFTFNFDDDSENVSVDF